MFFFCVSFIPQTLLPIIKSCPQFKHQIRNAILKANNNLKYQTMKRLIFTLVLFFIAGNLLAQQGPKVDTVVTQNWNGTTWQDTIKTVNTYDANCQLTSMLLQAWNPTSSAW